MQKLLQIVANVFLFSAIGLAQTTGKVNVYSPVSGSTVTSPAHFVASAQAPAARRRAGPRAAQAFEQAQGAIKQQGYNVREDPAASEGAL